MDAYGESTYGERIAHVYDELYGQHDPAAIDLLAALAGEGPVLELGIGTGRVALPLLERGLSVYGIDASAAMVDKLRAKPRGQDIHLQLGSFAEFELDRQFSLIYVVFNTFFALFTQEAQVHCFESVSRHLAPGGRFLIEAFVPDLGRFVDHQTVRAVDVDEGGFRLEVSKVDPATQQVSSQHVVLAADGIRLYPVKIRYAWPSELDLMARLAGLALRERWSSWHKDAFAKDSGKHISLYNRVV